MVITSYRILFFAYVVSKSDVRSQIFPTYLIVFCFVFSWSYGSLRSCCASAGCVSKKVYQVGRAGSSSRGYSGTWELMLWFWSCYRSPMKRYWWFSIRHFHFYFYFLFINERTFTSDNLTSREKTFACRTSWSLPISFCRTSVRETSRTKPCSTSTSIFFSTQGCAVWPDHAPSPDHSIITENDFHCQQQLNVLALLPFFPFFSFV